MLIYDFEPLKETIFDVPPDDGVYVYGFFLDGARFNMTTMKLDESLPKILYENVPYVSYLARYKRPNESYRNYIYDSYHALDMVHTEDKG